MVIREYMGWAGLKQLIFMITEELPMNVAKLGIMISKVIIMPVPTSTCQSRTRGTDPADGGSGDASFPVAYSFVHAVHSTHEHTQPCRHHTPS
jgi:hypothetical protein